MENIAKNIIKKNTENINENEVNIIPCNTGVLIKFYEDNPYRKIEKTQSGLIIGIESTKKYKSTDTGEIENNEIPLVSKGFYDNLNLSNTDIDSFV